ncbi:MAG: PEGA domain-containing protein [Patescibacteria group bacterium]
MTRMTRRIITASFILVFLITAPLIILYASGYRYNRKRGTMQGTSAITISTKPKGARVSINGIAQNELTPFRITQLFPTTYHLKVEKQGYTSWETTVVVEPWKNKLYSSVRLFSLTPPEALPPSCARHSILSHNPPSPWTLLSSSSSDPFILFNAHKKTCTPLKMDSPPIATTEDSSGNSYALLSLSRQPKLTVVNSPLIGNEKVRNFSLKRPATHITLLNDREVWAWDAASISRIINFGDQQTMTNLKVIDLLPLQNGLYTLEEDPLGTLILRLRNSDDPSLYRTIATLVLSPESQFIHRSPTDTLTILDNRSSRVVLIDLTRPESPPFEFSLFTHAAWSTTGEYLTLSNDHEISLLHYDKKKNGQRVTLLTRISDPLRSVLLIPEIGYVAYTTPTHLSFISLNSEIDSFPHTPFALPESVILGFSSDTLYLASQNTIFKYELP